jgi:hypothetical protein
MGADAVWLKQLQFEFWFAQLVEIALDITSGYDLIGHHLIRKDEKPVVCR